MMLSNILQALFGTINGIYIGQMIGVEALAAASVFFPIMFFFIAFIMGLSSGASVLIGQAWGAGNTAKVKAMAGTSLSVALLLAAAIAIAAGCSAGRCWSACHTARHPRGRQLLCPDHDDGDAADFVFILLTSMMRGVGDTVTPLLALAISTVIGLAITPALIIGWFGLPRLGVASAAWASAISSGSPCCG